MCRFTALTHYFRDKTNDGETWHRRRRREFRGENFAKHSIFAYITHYKVDTYFPITLCFERLSKRENLNRTAVVQGRG
jgi:hypothetical protein